MDRKLDGPRAGGEVTSSVPPRGQLLRPGPAELTRLSSPWQLCVP